jgi:inosose dehydratase
MRRRSFLAHGLGALSAAALWRKDAAALLAPRPEPAVADIRFGYAAITWGGNDRQAIDDIAQVGFRGIQLRSSAVQEWGNRPQDLRDLLAARGLTLVALSSGLVRIDPAFEEEDLALHLRHARFLRGAGGLYLQVLDERPRGRAVTPDDYRHMGRLLTELGRRTADLGIPLGYHNHMGNLGQSPDEVARVLDASDPRFVKLELDTAHYAQAGGDPAEAVRRYAGRLLFMHVKDVESPVPGAGPGSYRFVELGRGSVDFPSFFAALEGIRFSGWAIVELDEPVDPTRTPKDSAEYARAYLEQTLGLEV